MIVYVYIYMCMIVYVYICVCVWLCMCIYIVCIHTHHQTYIVRVHSFQCLVSITWDPACRGVGMPLLMRSKAWGPRHSPPVALLLGEVLHKVQEVNTHCYVWFVQTFHIYIPAIHIWFILVWARWMIHSFLAGANWLTSGASFDTSKDSGSRIVLVLLSFHLLRHTVCTMLKLEPWGSGNLSSGLRTPWRQQSARLHGFVWLYFQFQVPELS